MLNTYKKVTDIEPYKQMDSYSVYEVIKNGALKQYTEKIQEEFKNELTNGFLNGAKERYQGLKSVLLQCVTFSGVFDRNKPIEEQDFQHSGLINMDLDNNTKSELDEFFVLVQSGKIPFIEACARSVSGAINGSLWINVRIDMPKQFKGIKTNIVSSLGLDGLNYKSKIHTAYYEMFSEMLLDGAGIIGGKTKDVKRVRYLSHDSDIYVNKEARKLNLGMLGEWLESKKPKKTVKIDLPDGDTYQEAIEYAIAESEQEVGACELGNRHLFLVHMAMKTNRMGLPLEFVQDYVSGIMGINVTTNCLTGPYKKYSDSFGTWDWSRKNKPTTTPSPEQTAFIQPSKNGFIDGHFKPLGFDKDETGVQAFYFHAAGSQTPIRLTASKFSKNNLMMLAPLDWWEYKFPSKNGFSTTMATDWLIQVSNLIGYYTGRNLRGRGAWMDNDRVVIHAGNYLVVGSEKTKLIDIDSEFIYERGSDLHIGTTNPLKADEAAILPQILSRLCWDNDISADLLSGWLAIAPVCGVLKWRPHIWITGAAGSGKSTVFKEIIRPMLSNVCLAVQSGTTEPALRQLLQQDAIPIVFDEAEGEDQKSQDRMQSVLGLMRAASSDDGGVLAKGSSTGKAQTYTIRSVFAYASIVPQMIQQSDRRRITLLGLRTVQQTDKSTAHFKETMRMIVNSITPDFVERFQARIISLLPMLLKSIDVIVKEATIQLGNRAMADQYAPMIAGWWHIMNDDIIDSETAETLVGGLGADVSSDLDQTKDEIACIRHILTQEIRLDSGVYRSVAELISQLNGEMNDMGLTDSECKLRLGKCGIRLKDEFIAISNSSGWIHNALKQTPWAKNHGEILKRIDGAEVSGNAMYFSPTEKARAVIIPLDKIFSNE